MPGVTWMGVVETSTESEGHIRRCLSHSCHWHQPAREQHLMQILGTVPDPRDPRGVRYPLTALPSLAIGTVACVGTLFRCDRGGSADVGPQMLAMFGTTRSSAPDESTFRRVCEDVDAEELDRALGAFWWTRSHEVDGRRVIALDGKTFRGARDLLACFDLDGVTVTMDAKHCQDDTAEAITSPGGHYVLTVKGNRPRLRAGLKALPWHRCPPARPPTRAAAGE